MTARSWIELALYFVLLAGLSPLLGLGIAWVLKGERVPLFYRME